jgi:hypothetical protein
MDKNEREILFWAVIFILAAVFLVRFMTPEDDWICSKGQWVKHGNPSASMPTEPCPQEIK